MFLFMFSFVNCILFSRGQKAVCHFFVISFFFSSFYFQHVNCTLRYTEDKILFGFAWSWSTWPNLEVYFSWYQGSKWKIVASDEHLCLCDGNVTCCFNSCTLFFLSNIRAVILCWSWMLSLSIFTPGSLKKKQSPLTSKNSEHNLPELMSSQHFVYMSKMWHRFLQLVHKSIVELDTCEDFIVLSVPAKT